MGDSCNDEHLLGSDGYSPAIAWANWYQFRPTQSITHSHVWSRCFLWATHGSGTVQTAGRTFHLAPGLVLRLPWGHDVTYRADQRAPFRLGTVHVIPRHTDSDDVVVAISPLVSTAMSRTRLPGYSEGAAGTIDTFSGTGQRIVELGGLVIEKLRNQPRTSRALRLLAELILLEETDWSSPPAAAVLPRAFSEMTSYITANLNRPLSLADVSEAGDCSVTNAERLFRRHADCSIQTWVRDARMREACRLLGTSGLRINEVAATVGYSDPLYFSRVFRATQGVPPSRYALRTALP